MKAVKTIVFMVLYLIVTVIKFPFGLLGALFMLIEKWHVNVLATLVEWLGDDDDKRTFNTVLDTNALTLKLMGENWYLPMKFEL